MPLRSFTEAEIALKARRRLERPLLATIWLGGVMFSLAEGNLFYLLAGTFGVAVNLVAAERRREVYVSRLWVNLAVIVALLILALESYGTEIARPVALAHFMILIQVCKLFERKTNRDYVQMLALSILTVVAGALYTQSMWFAALLVVYTVLVAYSAMILTVKRGLDAAAAARLAGEPSPPSAAQVAWNVIRDWPGKALAGKLASALIWMAAAAMAVFVLVPRTEGWGVIPGEVSTTGYSSEVELGTPRIIQLSDKEVMRVTCDSPGGVLAGPLRYLRGRVLQFYSDSRWRRVPDRRRHRPLDPSSPLLTDAVAIDFSIDPSLLPDLFAPFAAVVWMTPAGQAAPDSDLTATLATGTTPNGPVAYRATVISDPLTEEQRDYLRGQFSPDPDWLPSQSVRVPSTVTALANRWCQDLLQERAASPSRKWQLDLAIARRITDNLRRNYKYSLDLSAADPGRDGVEDFLYHMKQGHCEYFASALTVMCCVLDVPARLATGFLADEQDPTTGQYIVREHDAHAWTEVYDGRGGWVVFDATPDTAGAADQTGWLTKASDVLTAIRYEWYRVIIGYDATVQRRLWAGVVGFTSQTWAVLKGLPSAIRQSVVNLLIHGYIDAAMVRVSVALGLIALMLEVALVARIRRRRIRRRLAAAALATRPWGQLVFVPTLLEDLERMGIGSQPSRTSLQTARQVADRLGLPGEALAALVDLYYRARWGHQGPSGPELAAARHQAEQIARSVSPALKLR